MRRNSVFALLERGDVLVTTVGPFAKWGEPAVRAAIAAHGTYIDSTGEPTFIRRVFEEFGAPAERAGATLLTAMGYDFVPGALAAALALEEAGEPATRVDIGYYALGAGISAGTRRSSVGVMLDESHTLPRRRAAAGAHGRARALVHGPRQGSARRCRSAAPSTSRCRTRIRGCARSTSTSAGSAALTRPMQAASLAGSLAMRMPGVRSVMKAAGDQVAGVGAGPEPGSGISWIVAEAYDAGGSPAVRGAPLRRRALRVHGRLPRLGGAPRRREGVDGTGALGPVQAFGLEALEAGCAAAGLRRVSDPAAG